MSCSYDEYLDQLAPGLFYGAGIPGTWRVAFVLIPVPFIPLFWSTSLARLGAGYAGAGVVALLSFRALRRWSLKHWSERARRDLSSLRERNAVVETFQTDALLARFDPEPELARRQLEIDLAAAERELQDRRTRKVEMPRWYGATMLALLATGLNLIPSSPRALATLWVIGAMTTAALGLVLLGKAVIDAPTGAFAGYVALLRRAKRQLDHEALRRAATIRPGT